MKCPSCQTENPEDSSFCRRCGQSLQVEHVCPQCGHTNLPDSDFCNKCGHALTEPAPTPAAPPSPEPTSFVDGRYQVKQFLGEGGMKRVYAAYDTILDRDVAFSLIKTERLDDASRKRISREAQSMGRLGSHPNIVTIFDVGEHKGQPYMVMEMMSGGDAEELFDKAAC